VSNIPHVIFAVWCVLEFSVWTH